ncbi:hypothetical protein A5707_02795 [Mycobacterium kyorinense]|uniref:Uncharacterized protein n=1 Tax=Mycobacterium kyorinense TaxID=487514 RepID=A0A1A2Z615_9MYCO|nr:hypothetical protein A5707_02795 [Mycobacterium kyorinense]
MTFSLRHEVVSRLLTTRRTACDGGAAGTASKLGQNRAGGPVLSSRSLLHRQQDVVMIERVVRMH